MDAIKKVRGREEEDRARTRARAREIGHGYEKESEALFIAYLKENMDNSRGREEK